MIDDVALLMHLAALYERGLAGMFAHRRRQRFAAVEDVQPRNGEVQTPRSTKMLLHIDGSKHRWFRDDGWYDLIVILDDATSEIYYAQLVEEEPGRGWTAPQARVD